MNRERERLDDGSRHSDDEDAGSRRCVVHSERRNTEPNVKTELKNLCLIFG
jgi:hypothetical protein